MHNFRRLHVYQKSLILAKSIQRITKVFPNDELFGLTSQLRRASYSISLNIAEGSSRRTGKDFSRYLGQAIGSGYESLACLDITLANEFIDDASYHNVGAQIDEIIAMLVGLQRRILQPTPNEQT